MIRRALPALALACAACHADASVRGIDVAPANAFAESRTADARPPAWADAFLVWSADSAAAETAWLDAGGRVVATRPQVVIAAGGAMWAWTKGKGTAKGIDCQCMARHGFEPGAHCPAQAEVETAAVVDLAGGRRAELVGVPPASDETAPVQQWTEPLASAGPFLFTAVRSYVDACGAHGLEGVEKPVYDLGDGGRVADLVGAGDSAAVLRREGAAARTRLEEGGQAWTPLEEFRLTAVEARWTPAGKLDVGYRFAAGACYACTDAEASAYSASALVPAAELPAKLAGLTDAPEAVRRFWREHPPRAHSGWSAVPSAALGAFQQP